MKNLINYLAMLSISAILLLTGCNSATQSNTSDEQDSGNNSEKAKLEKFLNIPVYPGAEMVMFITDDRDDEIPADRKAATVSMVIDHYDSVPVFYEDALGYAFLVDTSAGKTYYKLIYEKEGWEYEIYVGQDSFENKPMFSISMWEADR